MCASAVVMLDTPCFEVVWRVLTTHSIRQFPLHFPSRASPCAIIFQLESTNSSASTAFRPIFEVLVYPVVQLLARRGCQPQAQPLTWRARVSGLVCHLAPNFSNMGDPTGSYAVVDMTWCKPTPSPGWIYLVQTPLDARLLTRCCIKPNVKVSDKRFGKNLPFVHGVF